MGALVLVPTMVQMILDHPDFRPAQLSSLQQLAYGASPMPVPVLRRLRDLYPDLALRQVYGMTEASVGLTILTPEDHRGDERLLGSVGRPLPGVRLRVEDAAGTPLPAGEVEEGARPGWGFMKGYWNRERGDRACLPGRLVPHR